MTPLVKEFASLDEELALSCIWFDIGSRIASGDSIGSRLPFETCAIVGVDIVGNKFMVWAQQVEETSILLSAWRLAPEKYTRTPLFVASWDDGVWSVSGVEGEEQVEEQDSSFVLGILVEFMLCLHSTSGYKAAEKANSQTNMRRKRKGKAPLIYSWHSITIEQPVKKGEHLGGTHASPRLHERRGHWRNTSAGKRVWVRDCLVGDASRGIVCKDYKFGETK